MCHLHTPRCPHTPFTVRSGLVYCLRTHRFPLVLRLVLRLPHSCTVLPTGCPTCCLTLQFTVALLRCHGYCHAVAVWFAQLLPAVTVGSAVPFLTTIFCPFTGSLRFCRLPLHIRFWLRLFGLRLHRLHAHTHVLQFTFTVRFHTRGLRYHAVTHGLPTRRTPRILPTRGCCRGCYLCHLRLPHVYVCTFGCGYDCYPAVGYVCAHVCYAHTHLRSLVAVTDYHGYGYTLHALRLVTQFVLCRYTPS